MKSCERYYNNTIQNLPEDSTTQLTIAGAKVVDTGISIETQPQSYTTLKKGLYHIAGDVIITATAAGLATFYIAMDGVALPCTIKTVTLAVGNNAVHTETDLYLDGCCNDISHNFTFEVLTDETATGTITHLCTGIIKEA